uniref:NADH-ubiquinone oxidoreductase chain 6 n=1 Tax=Tenthredo tienmushana TaxID=1385159 RepID=A0A0U2E2I4_9HYME|nr:NADH dehydrogenase subunit 6 [Tenthredo tienmushana]
MLKILIIFTLLNSIMFYSSKTPLSMGLILLIQTILISLMSGMMSFNFWYTYILFLILIGSMLILFIYVSSLMSNLKFSLNKDFKNIFFYFLVMILFISTIFNMKFYLMINSDSINLPNLNPEQFFILKMSLNKLYNSPSNQIMLMLINYLLLTLFVVVKITNINMGPLRKNI